MNGKCFCFGNDKEAPANHILCFAVWYDCIDCGLIVVYVGSYIYKECIRLRYHVSCWVEIYFCQGNESCFDSLASSF